MEKFIAIGYKVGDRGHKFPIRMPHAKEFVLNTVENSEEQLLVITRDKFQPFHIRPCLYRNGKVLECPKTLQHVLQSHPYPLSQGLDIPSLDCLVEDKEGEIMKDRTLFRHDKTQACLEWTPDGKTDLILRVSS